MMQNNIYYFVDGSALIADVSRIHKKQESLNGKKLCLKKFAQYFTEGRYSHLTGGSFKRFVYYFVKGDDRVAHYFHVPNKIIPDEIDDVGIEYCGQKIRGAKKTEVWLSKNRIPKYVEDRLHRSEKAVDTQICCDALQLSIFGKLDRLFLYTNDSDYLPLCKSIKLIGANISLFRLIKEKVNLDLVSSCDSFNVVSDSELQGLFF